MTRCCRVWLDTCTTASGRATSAADIGGEEFVLLLPNTPGRNAVFLANRLCAGVADIMHSGLGIPSGVAITVSGGVATCPRDATDLDNLVRRADEALYEAKRAGRNRIVQAGIPDPPLDFAEARQTAARGAEERPRLQVLPPPEEQSRQP